MKYIILYLFLLSLISPIKSSSKASIKHSSDLIHNFNQKDFPNIKNYPLKTLAYITPWNKEGNKYVEKYSNKFDIISPTWFEIKPDEIDGELQFILDGSNNIDSDFMKNIKNKNENIIILPRLHAGFYDTNVMQIWFTKEVEHFIKILERRIKYNKFDGYVFDCMKVWFDKELLNIFVKNFLPKVYQSMNKLNKKFIITIIPKNSDEENFNSILDKNIFKEICKYVDYINIMTYDYHQYDKNEKYYSSPISWLKETIDFYVDKDEENADLILKKILIGIHFHGYSYEKNKNKIQDVITGTKFENILQNGDLDLNIDEKENEYILQYRNNVINYPNRDFIQKRLDISKDMKIGGIGIWDVGNGKESMIEPF